MVRIKSNSCSVHEQAFVKCNYSVCAPRRNPVVLLSKNSRMLWTVGYQSKESHCRRQNRPTRSSTAAFALFLEVISGLSRLRRWLWLGHARSVICASSHIGCSRASGNHENLKSEKDGQRESGEKKKESGRSYVII